MKRENLIEPKKTLRLSLKRNINRVQKSRLVLNCLCNEKTFAQSMQVRIRILRQYQKVKPLNKNVSKSNIGEKSDEVTRISRNIETCTPTHVRKKKHVLRRIKGEEILTSILQNSCGRFHRKKFDFLCKITGKTR